MVNTLQFLQKSPSDSGATNKLITNILNNLNHKIMEPKAIFLGAKTIVSNYKKDVKAGVKEYSTFTQVVKQMRVKKCYNHFANLLAELGIKSQDEVTVKAIEALFEPKMYQDKKVKNGKTTKVVKRFSVLKERLITKRVPVLVDGVQVMRNGKGITAAVPVLDADGKEQYEYVWAEVKDWSPVLVLTALAQAKKIRESK